MTGFQRAFTVLTGALRLDAGAADDAALAAQLATPDLDWTHLLRLADQEHVTGGMTVALRRRGLFDDLPRAGRAALRRRFVMGTELNTRIKSEAEEVVGLLNAAGVTPMLLKGGLYLFEAPPEALGGRVLGDLDMVVPGDALETCVDVLREAGYVPDDEHDQWTYHYRPMYHREKIVPIELHIRAGEQRNFITVEDAWAQAVPIEAGGLKMVALAPAHRLMHNIFHSEIQDAGYVRGAACLRQLCDLARICARSTNSIDWQSVETHMQRHGIARLFRARMHLAVALLGAPAPDIEIDGLRSRLHLRYCLIKQRSPRLANLTRWLAGIAGSFKRYHLDLLYECGTSGFSLQVHRAKHFWKLIRRYRGGLWKRLTKRGHALP